MVDPQNDVSALFGPTTIATISYHRKRPPTTAQSRSSNFLEWSYAAPIGTGPWRHYRLFILTALNKINTAYKYKVVFF